MTALVQPDGKYAMIMGEIVPGQVWGASSPSGPWTSLGNYSTDTNGHNNCGDLSSNATFTLGPDNRYWGSSRGGCIMNGDKITGPYKLVTDSVLPDLERGDNRQAEDEVIWYSGGYYHVVWNYWDKQRAYHIMSKDGVSNWTSTGAAYQGTQSPPTQYANWLRYTDGTINNWHNMERPGVYIENGHPAAFTFAVTDTDKNTSAVNSGGSKIIVVPFNGVQFDCDNGDSASCAELTKDAGVDGAAGSNGQGGASGGTGGATSGSARGGSGGSLGSGGTTGTARAGADGGVGGQGGKSSGAGGTASGGAGGVLSGGTSGGAGASGGAASGGARGSITGGTTGTSVDAGGAGARGSSAGSSASGGHVAGEAATGSGGSSAGRISGSTSEGTISSTNRSSGCSCSIQGPGPAGKRQAGLGLLVGIGPHVRVAFWALATSVDVTHVSVVVPGACDSRANVAVKDWPTCLGFGRGAGNRNTSLPPLAVTTLGIRPHSGSHRFARPRNWLGSCAWRSSGAARPASARRASGAVPGIRPGQSR